MQAANVISWFEIPASDLERAVWFYESVFEHSLKRDAMDGTEMAIFPSQQPGVGGCIAKSYNLHPAEGGSLVYLRTAEIDATLHRVERAGGRILLNKTQLPDGMGYFAHIVDSEGNRIGLHSLQ